MAAQIVHDDHIARAERRDENLLNIGSERIAVDRAGQSNSSEVGWEYVHVCIDDHSRIAFTSIYPDEKAVSAIASRCDAIRYYAGLGVTVERVMSDNGSCYKSFAFRDACKALGLRRYC